MEIEERRRKERRGEEGRKERRGKQRIKATPTSWEESTRSKTAYTKFCSGI